MIQMMKCKPIPGFSKYSITKNGKIIRNIKTGDELAQQCVGGYYVTKLFNDKGDRVSVRINRIKPVIQYDGDGAELNWFPSVQDAAEHMRVDPTNISGAASGKHGSAAGFIWRFEDNPLKKGEKIQIGETRRVKRPVIQYDEFWDEYW